MKTALDSIRSMPRDFFDLIIVDECHRGSAKDGSNWREILSYFHPAFQLGMTATPLAKDNRDTYRYFGNPVYTYSFGKESRTDSCTLSSSSHYHRVGCGRMVAEPGRARSLRSRDPGQRVSNSGFRTRRGIESSKPRRSRATSPTFSRRLTASPRQSYFASIRNMPMRCGGRSIISMMIWSSSIPIMFVE